MHETTVADKTVRERLDRIESRITKAEQELATLRFHRDVLRPFDGRNDRQIEEMICSLQSQERDELTLPTGLINRPDYVVSPGDQWRRLQQVLAVLHS